MTHTDPLPDAWSYPGDTTLLPPPNKVVTPGRIDAKVERVLANKVHDHDVLYDLLASIGPDVTADQLYAIHLQVVPAAWVVAYNGSRQLTLDRDDFTNKDLYTALASARRYLNVDNAAWFARLQADANMIADYDAWLVDFQGYLTAAATDPKWTNPSWTTWSAVSNYRRWDAMYDAVAAGRPVTIATTSFTRDRLSHRSGTA